MINWRSVTSPLPQGIILASDEKQQWMLPWWWENYARHNSYPVTFVDLGLSHEAQDWCKERGELITLPSFAFQADKESVDPSRVLFWETIYEGRKWWDKRSLWHQKPAAMLQTPYEKTLWLDTDCEVKGDLAPLFGLIGDSLLICPEIEEMQEFDRSKGHLLEGEILYNSGVIGFKRGSPYILDWASATVSDHVDHWSDQNLLSRLIYDKKWPIHTLDRIYNWREASDGKNPDVKISHWVGEAGKFFISLKMQQFL